MILVAGSYVPIFFKSYRINIRYFVTSKKQAYKLFK